MSSLEIDTWELIAARCAEESFENSQKRKGGKWNPYVHKVLRGAMRDYIIDKVKKPLLRVITTLAKRYPEPTRENVLHPNSHILLDIRDEFFKHDTNDSRKDLFEALFKMLVAEYEHDGYYRFRFNWLHDEINKRKWLPNIEQTHHWTE